MGIEFPFQLRFLFASYPQIMSKVLAIVCRTFATHITNKAGYNKKTAQTGAVTLIQRFGSALNLNIHFHMLYLDGVYVEDAHGNVKPSCFILITHLISYLQPHNI
jgi:hypothetical protein